MQITIFSVWMTFVWCSIFIVLCYILRKRSVLLNLSSMTGIIILYLFCLIDRKSFTSSNPKVVAVNKKTGKLTAKKAGKATITVTTGSGRKAKMKVVVK